MYFEVLMKRVSPLWGAKSNEQWGLACILRIKQNFSRTGTKMKRVPVLNKL